VANCGLNRDYTAAKRVIGKAVSITGPLRGRARKLYDVTT
jgi:hypothetical protein